MNGLPATKLWDSPVEAFFWDGRLSIRDKFKKTIFFIELDTREYHTVKRLREQIVPKLVEMMNDYAVKDIPIPFMGRVIEDHPDMVAQAQNVAISSENGSKVVEAPKRRGNPNWIKGYKRK